MTGPQYQTAVFNLAGGTGKHRLTPAATERNVRRWSTCITISEEIGFADKVKRDGRSPAAGAVARTWEIDVDDAEILDDETIARMKEIDRNFGHAAPIFINHLVEKGYPKNVEMLRQKIKAAENKLCSLGDAPQKRRVAGAAAILLVAGETAQSAGLIDAGYDVHGAILRVLKRSHSRMARNMDPVEAALTNLREGVLGRLGFDIRDLDYDQDTVHREVVGYYGYESKPKEFRGADKTPEGRVSGPDERIYFLPVEKLMELGGGNVTAEAIARALNKQGDLITASKKNSRHEYLPKGQKVQHYRVKGSFFHEKPEAIAMAAE